MTFHRLLAGKSLQRHVDISFVIIIVTMMMMMMMMVRVDLVYLMNVEHHQMTDDPMDLSLKDIKKLAKSVFVRIS